jgi:hypothetical protein
MWKSHQKIFLLFFFSFSELSFSDLQIPDVSRICISDLYFGSVILECISDLYFSDVSRNCISRMCSDDKFLGSSSTSRIYTRWRVLVSRISSDYKFLGCWQTRRFSDVKFLVWKFLGCGFWKSYLVDTSEKKFTDLTRCQKKHFSDLTRCQIHVMFTSLLSTCQNPIGQVQIVLWLFNYPRSIRGWRTLPRNWRTLPKTEEHFREQ